MFLFIGGVQPKTVKLGKRPRTCPRCGYLTLQLKRVDHYLSLFFIPLFPVKKGTPILSCENCQAAFDEAGGPMDIGGFPEPKPSQCPSCKRPVKPNYSFCPFCGKPM